MTADERLALIRRKVEWANTHFENLEVIKKRFIKGKPYTIDSEPDSKAGHEGLYRFFPTYLGPIDPRIALLAGDIIHNVRSALDHLACHLVEAAGNKPSPKTCFPIFKGTTINEPAFAAQVKGMRDSAKNRIRDTEAYKGGKGRNLWAIHKLDIADKHHGILTTLFRLGTVSIPSRGGIYDFVFPLFAVPNYGNVLEVGKTFLVCAPEEYEEINAPFDIALNEPFIDPLPILFGMRRAIDIVDNLIISFKSELI
jgi:hypothetical protein